MKNKQIPIKTVVYYDELKDEFSSSNITPKKIDENYKYYHKNIFWHFARFIIYRCIAMPIGYFLLKFGLKHKIKNRKVIKQTKKSGCFLFANHTQQVGDAFIPTFVSFPKSVYVVVHADNVSLPVIGKAVPLLGALPLPDTLGAMRNFKDAINKHVKNKKCITIYPEAHIWPYYTGIRNFPPTSFRYPVELNVPSYAMTTTYQQTKPNKKPKAITYLDGPFYPNEKLSVKEQIQDLRDRVYNAMLERSKLSNCEYIKYVKGEKTND